MEEWTEELELNPGERWGGLGRFVRVRIGEMKTLGESQRLHLSPTLPTFLSPPRTQIRNKQGYFQLLSLPLWQSENHLFSDDDGDSS